MNLLASQHHTHARVTPPKKYRKIYHTLPWWLNTAVKCTRVPITIQKMPCITVGAEYHGSMYQSGRLPPKKYRTVGAEYHGSMYQSVRLPSKKYRALPWCLITVVNATNLKNRYRGEPWKIWHPPSSTALPVPTAAPSSPHPYSLPRPLGGNSPPQRDHFINYRIRPGLSHTRSGPGHTYRGQQDPVLDGVPLGQLGIEGINNNDALSLTVLAAVTFTPDLPPTDTNPAGHRPRAHSLDFAPMLPKAVVIGSGERVAFGHWITFSNSQVSPTMTGEHWNSPVRTTWQPTHCSNNVSRRSGVRFLGEVSQT